MEFGLAEDTTKFGLGCLFIFIVYVFMQWWSYTRHLPPGPIGIPLFGYFPFLGKRPHETLREQSKKYGDVMSLYIGSHLVVCVSDYDAAKEIFSNPLTFSRPKIRSPDFNFGLINLDGKEWQQHRSFVMQTMKSLGLGGSSSESMIHEGLAELINTIRNFQGKPTWIEEELHLLEVKQRMYTFSGRRFTKDENFAEIKTIQQGGRKLLPYLSPVGIVALSPWKRKVLQCAQLSNYQEFLHLLKEYQNILRNEVNIIMQSEGTFSRNDFITFYLDKMKHVIQTSHSFTVENLIGDLTTLLITSADAAALPNSWLLLLMAKHQNIQEKVHEEIDSTIGRDGVVHYEDRGKLPYTMATLMEMFRWVSIITLPSRCTLEEFKFKDYIVPKGCTILINMWGILHDPRYFSEPMEFRPERFLDETHTKVVQVKGYDPFSLGKRKCPGELATMMICYIYFVAIMQKFKVTFPPGKEGDLDREFGSSAFPKPQGLCFLER